MREKNQKKKDQFWLVKREREKGLCQLYIGNISKSLMFVVSRSEMNTIENK